MAKCPSRGSNRRLFAFYACMFATGQWLRRWCPEEYGPKCQWACASARQCRMSVFTAQRVCIARTMPWHDVCLSVCLSHAGILS